MREDVLRLRALGMSYAEIGSELGVTRNAVAGHLNRADATNKKPSGPRKYIGLPRNTPPIMGGPSRDRASTWFGGARPEEDILHELEVAGSVSTQGW